VVVARSGEGASPCEGETIVSNRGRISRRAAVKGAVGAALATSQVSRSMAAPAVIRQTGSKVDVVYWGSYGGTSGEFEQ
jgi:hypothetical protein